MSCDVLIGIDAGTSVLKAVAFSLDGQQLDQFSLPNRFDSLPNGGAEQDMARTWVDCAACLRGLAEKVPCLAQRTALVSVTGQGDGTWMIDSAGEPVGPAWLWLDARSSSLVESLRASERGRDHYEVTGCGLAACQQGPQLAWMLQHTPESLARAATAFHCKDWLYFKLTGIRATDPSEGLFSFGDYRTRDYSDRVIGGLGLSGCRGLMAPMVDSTEQQHVLTEGAAAATGLLAGTPVALGFVDIVCSALGSGLYDPAGSSGCTIIGSTGMHIRMVGGAGGVIRNAQMSGYTIAWPIPGQFAQVQSNMASTLNIDWLLDMMRGAVRQGGVEFTRDELLRSQEDRIAKSAPAQIIYHPYILEAGERGPILDSAARASFIGLGEYHTYADMMRAVFEGLAYSARDCYAAMGSIPSEVRLSGGASRNPALRGIMAAVLGSKVRTTTRKEAGAAGAAMIGAVGAGHYSTMADCAADWVLPYLDPIEEPDPDLVGAYDKMFPVYLSARKALTPIWRQLGSRQAAVTSAP